MDLEIGTILPGKVTGITKFGAFVSIAPGKSGLVHISEIANTYVSDVNDFLSVGQEVSVKLISIDDSGRINLSIKQAAPPAPPRRPVRETPREVRKPTPPPETPAPVAQPQADSSFEDKLKRFMQDSDSRMSGVKLYSEKRTSRRGGSGRNGRN